MKKLVVLSLLVSSVSFGYETEVSTVLSHPDRSLDFTMELVKSSIDLVRSNVQRGTGYYSILARRDVRSATSIGVVSDQGTSDYATLIAAIKVGAERSRVVAIFVGPNSAATCSTMASFPNTVFVTAAEFNPPSECSSGNIVSVAVLNASRTMLNAGFDFLNAKIAAPGTDIWVIEAGSKLTKVTARGAASAFVAAHLVQIGRANPNLNGSELATALYGRTKRLSTIEQKVELGRALDDSGY